MKGSLSEQPKATIYQYRLIRKIGVRNELRYSHLVIVILFSAFELLLYGIKGAAALLIGFIVTPIIQLAIVRLTLIRADEPDDRRWSWHTLPPLVGYIPAAHIELGLFRKIQRHLLWLGLCVIGIVYPWASEAQMISLIIWHLWYIAPRLIIVRMLRKENRNGVLKIQKNEVNYYHR